MQPGDVIFVRGHWGIKNPVDDAIKIAEIIKDHTLNGYTHCAIFIGNGQVAEAQGGRLSGKASLSTYEGDYDIGHAKLTDAQRPLIVAEAQKEYGLHYGWHRIEEITENTLLDVPLPPADEHEPICTQYVKQVFQRVIGAAFNCGDTPEELSRDPLFEIEHLVVKNDQITNVG